MFLNLIQNFVILRFNPIKQKGELKVHIFVICNEQR